MDIKAVVVDMDGTFLADDKSYNRERFLDLKKRMNAMGMHFVVASGNQYWRLVDYFPDLGEKLFYIADNGADIRYHGEQLEAKTVAPEFHRPIIEFLETQLPDHQLVVSGSKGVYCSDKSSQAQIDHVTFFYRHIQAVDFHEVIEDDVFKFALGFSADRLNEAHQQLFAEFGQDLMVVTSGHQALDIVSLQAGKEVGVRALMKKFDLKPEEIAVFGDNMNDVGMFKEVTYSYAMGNGLEAVKEAAYEVIGTNNEEAVLDKIESFVLAKEQAVK